MSITKQASLSTCTKEILSSKKVANNTFWIIYKDGSAAYRLHSTDVFTSNQDGNVILNSGGWKTATTKDRINAYSKFKISQTKGVWTVHTPKGTFDYFDGIEITPDGIVLNPITIDRNEIEKTKKAISKYCSLITKDNLPIPDGGDCWYCSMRTKEGATMGDSFQESSHLISHMDEGYVVGSLLVNAMREAGYPDSSIAVHYSMKLADTFKRSVRKYMQKRLIK